jgi:hypothetical protein
MTFDPYQPQLRKVTANVLTPLGWLHGTFNVPPMQMLLDFLGSNVHVFKFTRVRVPSEPEALAFVGLTRTSSWIIEPMQRDEQLEAPGAGRVTGRSVACLFPTGVLRGTLDVLVNVRVSDYLRQQLGMVVMADCVFAPYGEKPDSPLAKKMPRAIVNLEQSIGIAEAQGTGNRTV